MSKKLVLFLLVFAGLWLTAACEVVDPFEEASVVDVGDGASCAVEVNSSEVYCWGQLRTSSAVGVVVDYGPLASRVAPGQMYQDVAVGSGHVCATKFLAATDGIQCWGANNYGQLGDGTTTQSASPVDVIGLPAGTYAVDISARTWTTCAALNTGALYCWGRNASGQLGDGTNVSTFEKSPPHPQPVLTEAGTPLTDVVAVSVGRTHACALKGDASMWCWGSNSHGQLGVGPSSDKTSTVQVPLADVETIVAGPSASTCAVDTGGALFCWGDETVAAETDTPTEYNKFSEAPVHVALGSGRACAAFASGVTECVGLGLFGTLGNGSNAIAYDPVTVTGSTSVGFSRIYMSGSHACGRTMESTPRVRCWGQGDRGQLGDGNMSGSSSVPVVVGKGSQT